MFAPSLHRNQLKLYKVSVGISVFRPSSILSSVKEENDENLCADYDEEDCRYAFVYYFDKDYKVHVRAQEERECPPKVS